MTSKKAGKFGRPRYTKAYKAALRDATMSFAMEVRCLSLWPNPEIERALGIGTGERGRSEGSAGMFSKYSRGVERLSPRRLVQLARAANDLGWLSETSYHQIRNKWAHETYTHELDLTKKELRVLLPVYEGLLKLGSALDRLAAIRRVRIGHLRRVEVDPSQDTDRVYLERIRRHIPIAADHLSSAFRALGLSRVEAPDIQVDDRIARAATRRKTPRGLYRT